MCADCTAKNPTWASINLGITLCTECVGIHRGLGTHISKTRSLSLDVRVWEPEVVKVMAELGNTISNKIYEAQGVKKQFGGTKKATRDTGNIQRRLWITAKYVHKAFVNKDISKVMEKQGAKGKTCHIYENWTVKNRKRRMSSKRKHEAGERQSARKAGAAKNDAEQIFFGSSLNKMGSVPVTVQLDSDQESLDGISDDSDPSTALHDDHAAFTPDNLLCRASRAHNLPLMAAALAFGADKDHGGAHRAVHQAVKSGSVRACEFLILNGAKLNVVDKNQG